MKTFIALLRGINVGGKGILPMKDLVASLAELGCVNVRTYIQSGNVVLRIKQGSAKTLASRLSASIQASHGFTPHVLLIDAADFLRVIEDCPYRYIDGKQLDGKQLHVFFLQSTPKSPDLTTLESIKTPSEKFHLVGNVFYLFTPDGIGRSKLAAKAERCLGVAATARNWNTVAKLQAMLAEE